jgi:SulP family sulfate permease
LSGIIVLIAVYLLIPVISLLPFGALAPIIISGALNVMDFREIKTAFLVDTKEGMIMVITLVVSLAWTVKEGLAAGFFLGLVHTIYGLANPNFSLLGKYKDQLRDVRTYVDAKKLDNCVFVRMDARLNYANARKFREFISRAMDIHQAYLDNLSRSTRLEFVVVDCKSMNDCDVTGIETLAQVAETLYSLGIRVAMVNIKGPLMKRLRGTHLLRTFTHLGGHLSDNLEDVLAVVEGRDTAGAGAKDSVGELLTKLATRQKTEALARYEKSFCLAVPV